MYSTIQKISEVLFPDVRLCYGEGGGYNYSRLEQLGYKDLYHFIIGKKPQYGNGWISPDKTPEDLFKAVYTEPQLETLIRNGWFQWDNNGAWNNISWHVSPMTYPGGRCLTLNYSKTNSSETILHLNFYKLNFIRNVELSITGC